MMSGNMGLMDLQEQYWHLLCLDQYCCRRSIKHHIALIIGPYLYSIRLKVGEDCTGATSISSRYATSIKFYSTSIWLYGLLLSCYRKQWGCHIHPKYPWYQYLKSTLLPCQLSPSFFYYFTQPYHLSFNSVCLHTKKMYSWVMFDLSDTRNFLTLQLTLASFSTHKGPSVNIDS